MVSVPISCFEMTVALLSCKVTCRSIPSQNVMFIIPPKCATTDCAQIGAYGLAIADISKCCYTNHSDTTKRNALNVSL